MNTQELRQRWQLKREEFAQLAVHVDGVRVIDAFLADLDSRERDEADELLSVARAASLSGYSPEHLARCIRTGKIPNAGVKGRPRIRRADLPRKPKKSLESGAEKAYDVYADARSILSRRGER